MNNQESSNTLQRPPVVMQPNRLARGSSGEALTIRDESGQSKYIYSGGGVDEGSRVDERNPHAEAGQMADQDYLANKRADAGKLSVSLYFKYNNLQDRYAGLGPSA